MNVGEEVAPGHLQGITINILECESKSNTTRLDRTAGIIINILECECWSKFCGDGRWNRYCYKYIRV